MLLAKLPQVSMLSYLPHNKRKLTKPYHSDQNLQRYLSCQSLEAGVFTFLWTWLITEVFLIQNKFIRLMHGFELERMRSNFFVWYARWAFYSATNVIKNAHVKHCKSAVTFWSLHINSIFFVIFFVWILSIRNGKVAHSNNELKNCCCWYRGKAWVSISV